VGYFSKAGVFLLDVIFGLYIYAVLLRFMLQQARADFSNPLAHFLVVITSPVLRPLRRVIPGVSGIDLASIVLLLALEFVFQTLLTNLMSQPWLFGFILVRSVFHLVACVTNVHLYGILIVVILSWVNPYPNAVSQLVGRLVEPVLRPARRWIPTFSGLDLSPMAVMIVILLIQMALPYLESGTIDLLR